MSDLDTNGKNLPAHNEPNPFEEIAASTPRRIIGKLLKFSKGDYLYGQDNEELPYGTRLIANMDQLLVGWIKWQDQKPVEQIMGLVVEGFKPMKLTDLPDRDESEWETDDKGNPRDPWQKTYYLVMRELDEEGKPKDDEEGLYTFTTSSTGGKDAMIELCARYGKWMRVHPNQYPIVTLAKPGKYNHPNKAFGVIKVPKLEFNPKKDWIDKEMFGDISNAPTTEDEEDIPF